MKKQIVHSRSVLFHECMIMMTMMMTMTIMAMTAMTVMMMCFPRKPSSCMIFSLCIFLSAIKVCRQQIGIIIKVKSNTFDCTVYRILHFQSFCVLCLHILYKRVRANCHQHKTIWWHGRLWLYCILDHHHHPESLEREEKSFKVCYVFLSLACWVDEKRAKFCH